jgi:hypothetical protein
MTESDLERPVKQRVPADNEVHSPDFRSMMDKRFTSSSEPDTPSQDGEDY